MKAFTERLAIALLDSKHKKLKSPIALRDGSSGVATEQKGSRAPSSCMDVCVCVRPGCLL